MHPLIRLLAAAAIIYAGIVVFGLPHNSNISLFYDVDLFSTTISIPYGVFTMPKLWGAILIVLGLWELQKTFLGST